MEAVGGAVVALMVGFVIMCVLDARKRWERSKDPPDFRNTENDLCT
jgi:hypothetical protein